MVRKIIITCFISVVALFCTIQIMGQSSVDSLVDLSHEQLGPQELISINNKLGNLLRQPYPDSALRYYRRSLKLAQMKGLTHDYIDAYSNIGISWVYKGNNDSAVFYLEESIKLAGKNNYSEGVASGYNSLGLVEVRRRQYEDAIPYFNKVFDILGENNGQDLTSKVYNNLGLAYKRLHKYDSSLYYYLESLKIKEAVKDLKGIGITTNNIALVYQKLGEIDLSIKYLDRSLLIRKQLSNSYGQAVVYNNLGLMYEAKNMPDTALEYYLNALDLFKVTHRKAKVAVCYNNIGSVYAQLKNYKMAIDYLDKSLKMSQKSDDLLGQANSYLDLADFYSKLRNYYKSIQNYRLSYKIGKEIDDFDIKIESFKGLYGAFEQLGRNDSALHYYRTMIQYKDSLLIAESRQRVELLEIQYQTLKKEKENEELLKENHINRAKIKQGLLVAVLLAVLLVFFIILAMVTIYNRNKIKKTMKLISAQKSEIEVQSTQLEQTYQDVKDLSQFKEEMSGMIVHDLKNPINTIINLADIGKSSENALLVKHSAKKMLNLVMNILDVQKYEDAGVELNKQNCELRYVIFRAIDEVRFNAQLKNIDIILPQTIDYIVDVDTVIFERVFINLLTNALKFSPEGSKIEIKYEALTDTNFIIHVIDKGPGISADMKPIIFHKYKQDEKKSIGYAGSTGIGLSFCRIAIESHNGEIGVDSRLGLGSDFWMRIDYIKRIRLDNIVKQSVTHDDDLEMFISYDVKELIRPHAERLSRCLVYQISEIRKEMIKLNDMEHQAVEHFANKLNEAVLACDEKRYKNLLEIVLSK